MRLLRSSFLFPLSLLLVAVLPLSGCDSVGSEGDSEPLTAPSNVTATGQTGAVELTWSSVDAADGYNLYRSTAETDEVALDDRIRLFMKSLIPPKVVHGIVFLAPEWMNALSLITTVALVGTVVLWGVIEIRWWLRRRDVAFRSPISIEEQE